MTKYSFLTVGLSGSVPAHFDPDLILDAIKCPGGPDAMLVPYCRRRAIEYLNFLSDIVSKWAIERVATNRRSSNPRHAARQTVGNQSSRSRSPLDWPMPG